MAASLVFRLDDRGPELVREVLLERGWEEYNEGEREEEDWNLYWRGSLFQTSQYHNLLPWQRLNHHPKTVGITRKVHVYIDFFFLTSCHDRRITRKRNCSFESHSYVEKCKQLSYNKTQLLSCLNFFASVLEMLEKHKA